MLRYIVMIEDWHMDEAEIYEKYDDASQAADRIARDNYGEDVYIYVANESRKASKPHVSQSFIEQPEQAC